MTRIRNQIHSRTRTSGLSNARRPTDRTRQRSPAPAYRAPCTAHPAPPPAEQTPAQQTSATHPTSNPESDSTGSGSRGRGNLGGYTAWSQACPHVTGDRWCPGTRRIPHPTGIVEPPSTPRLTPLSPLSKNTGSVLSVHSAALLGKQVTVPDMIHPRTAVARKGLRPAAHRKRRRSPRSRSPRPTRADRWRRGDRPSQPPPATHPASRPIVAALPAIADRAARESEARTRPRQQAPGVSISRARSLARLPETAATPQNSTRRSIPEDPASMIRDCRLPPHATASERPPNGARSCSPPAPAQPYVGHDVRHRSWRSGHPSNARPPRAASRSQVCRSRRAVHRQTPRAYVADQPAVVAADHYYRCPDGRR